MLVAMLTAMYMVVRAAESVGARWARQPDPLPYLVSQPPPWQLQSVTSRRSSKAEEVDLSRRSSMGAYRKNFFPNSTMAATLAIPCLLTCPDVDERTGPPTALPSPVEAAKTIQNQYRKYQQKKNKEAK